MRTTVAAEEYLQQARRADVILRLTLLNGINLTISLAAILERNLTLNYVHTSLGKTFRLFPLHFVAQMGHGRIKETLLDFYIRGNGNRYHDA